jgi:HEPN domain-containing protein
MAKGNRPRTHDIKRFSREAAVQHSDALRREIRRHNYLYYVANKPAISDAEYDRLFEALKRLAAASRAIFWKSSLSPCCARLGRRCTPPTLLTILRQDCGLLGSGL